MKRGNEKEEGDRRGLQRRKEDRSGSKGRTRAAVRSQKIPISTVVLYEGLLATLLAFNIENGALN